MGQEAAVAWIPGCTQGWGCSCSCSLYPRNHFSTLPSLLPLPFISPTHAAFILLPFPLLPHLALIPHGQALSMLQLRALNMTQLGPVAAARSLYNCQKKTTFYMVTETGLGPCSVPQTTTGMCGACRCRARVGGWVGKDRRARSRGCGWSRDRGGCPKTAWGGRRRTSERGKHKQGTSYLTSSNHLSPRSSGEDE